MENSSDRHSLNCINKLTMMVSSSTNSTPVKISTQFGTETAIASNVDGIVKKLVGLLDACTPGNLNFSTEIPQELGWQEFWSEWLHQRQHPLWRHHQERKQRLLTKIINQMTEPGGVYEKFGGLEVLRTLLEDLSTFTEHQLKVDLTKQLVKRTKAPNSELVALLRHFPGNDDVIKSITIAKPASNLDLIADGIKRHATKSVLALVLGILGFFLFKRRSNLLSWGKSFWRSK